MNSYCYIFLLRKKLVSVFRFRNGQWEHITRDGLDESNVDNTKDLIDWWKEEAAYSDHPLSEEQRRQALSLLWETERAMLAQADWKRKLRLKFGDCVWTEKA